MKELLKYFIKIPRYTDYSWDEHFDQYAHWYITYALCVIVLNVAIFFSYKNIIILAILLLSITFIPLLIWYIIFQMFGLGKKTYRYTDYYIKNVNEYYEDEYVFYEIDAFLSKTKSYDDIQKQFCLDLFRFYYHYAGTSICNDLFESNNLYNGPLSITGLTNEDLYSFLEYFYTKTQNLIKKEKEEEKSMLNKKLKYRKMQLDYQLTSNC